MGTDTRDKLEEASYFLERLGEVSSERDAFRYTLSAFLAAANSVPEIMNKEFQRANMFTAWFRNQMATLNEVPVRRLFHEKRRVTMHRRSPNPFAQVKVKPRTAVLTFSSELSTVIIRVDGSTEASASNTSTLPHEPPPPAVPSVPEPAPNEWRWYFNRPGGEGKDVLSLAREYLSILKCLVEGCEERFVTR